MKTVFMCQACGEKKAADMVKIDNTAAEPKYCGAACETASANKSSAEAMHYNRVTVARIIAELKTEIGQRERVYSRQVDAGKMRITDMHLKIACIEKAADILCANTIKNPADQTSLLTRLDLPADYWG